MVQAYALFGVYALGLLTLLAAGAPATLGRRRDCWPTAALFGLLALVYIGGQTRLATATDAVVPGIGLRLVQPNIPQREKWRRDRLARNFARHLELSTAVSTIDITHLVWPETATPFFVTSDAERRRILGSVVPAGGFLITGSPRRGPRGQRPRKLWNSVHAVDDRGEVVASYDKHHLVPFGEYLPFRRLMAGLGLDKLAAGSVDYSPGPGPRLISLDGLPPFQPLICYEAIFADEIARPRPSWLLNLTNDAWFGASFGPAQHFQMARARAVEQGLPLVRVANTGISAVVDAYGRVRARLAVATAGVIDSPLPVALAQPPPYARFGDVALLPPIVWLAALLLWRLRRRLRGLP
jgi:apolipoprotein N-acyltransferase